MLLTVPNVVTLVNLFCGIAAIYYLQIEDVTTSYVFLIIGLFADFLDGTLARLLNQSSSIGKELDSLADLVSFGVLPGYMMFQLMYNTDVNPMEWAFCGFILSLAAALRLAKFNISTDQSKDFKGLTTPPMTIAIFGIHAAYYLPMEIRLQFSFSVLLIVTLVLSFLMLTDLDLLSFKIDREDKVRTGIQLLIVVLSFAAFCAFGYIGFTFGIIFYILLSVVYFKLLQKA